MANELKLVGLKAVLEGFAPFMKQSEQLNKQIQQVGKTSKDAAKDATSAGGEIGGLSKIVSGLISPVGLATIAIAGLAAGFLALANRGASLRGISESFDRLTASAGILSNRLLRDLREASAGTISDFNLMRIANVALAGATGKVATEFGTKLPKLLEIARIQARATGQDVNFLFNSLVSGVKRGSPLLIDNTGLVLKVGEANEQYAASIGKTVEQLTSEDRQIALLNATLEAGAEAAAKYGDIQETAAEKIARGGATISNIFDGLSLAIQPAFEGVLNIINEVLTGIGNVVEVIKPIINFFSQVVGNIFNDVAMKVREFFAVLSDPAQRKIAFEGAANVIASFANGILKAANEFVFPAIINIATFIADFLVGQSPPPKGPLSQIDKGGAAIMQAWIGGFTGVSLQPIQEVTAEVMAALGNIATLGRKVIEQRLMALDAALKPFSDRLDIVKSNFEAIQAPAEAALRAIDRQLDNALQSLARGEAGSAEIVRQLDAQRASIEANLDAQQAQVDFAEIQLALAKAQQVQERTLLGIRLSQIPVVKKLAKAGTKVTEEKKAKGPKEKKLTGEAPAPEIAPEPVTGGLAKSTAEAAAVTGDLSGADLAEEFGSILDDKLRPQLDQFEENRAALGEQFDRIGQGAEEGKGVFGVFKRVGDIFDPSSPGSFAEKLSNLGTSIGDWVGDIGKAVDEHIVQPFVGFIRDNLVPFFTDSTRDGSIPNGIRNFLSKTLPAILPDLISGIETNIVAPFVTFVANDLIPFFTDVNRNGSIPNAIQNFIAKTLPGFLGGLGQAIQTNIVDPIVNSEAVQSIIGFFSDPEQEGSIPWAVNNLNTVIQSALENPGKFIQDSFVTPIQDAVNGLVNFLTNSDDPDSFAGRLRNFFGGNADQPGSLASFLQQALTFFSSLPALIGQALKAVGGFVWDNLVIPIIDSINWVIDQLNGFLQTIRDAIVPIINLTGGHADQAAINGIPHLDKTRPAWAGGATGGIFGMKVGERGSEFITSAEKLAVFPHTFVNAVEMLNRTMLDMSASVTQPVPMMNSSTVYNHNMNNYFQSSGSRPGDDMARIAMMRALR